MSEDLRENRIAEIESDLWELQHDPVSRRLHPSLHIVARLIMGVPCDVCWRVEQESLQPESFSPRAVFTAAIALAAALWIVPVWYARADSSRSTRIEECAGAFESKPTSTTRADYRMHVITCAGAFFASR
jgi:hypothetical protein